MPAGLWQSDPSGACRGRRVGVVELATSRGKQQSKFAEELMTREDRRTNRKRILQALQSETGSLGGSAAEERVEEFIANPIESSPADFMFVGALTLKRFFIDSTKPNASERRSLWQEMLTRLGQGRANDPGKWGGGTNVSQLQAIIEEALGLE